LVGFVTTKVYSGMGADIVMQSITLILPQAPGPRGGRILTASTAIPSVVIDLCFPSDLTFPSIVFHDRGVYGTTLFVYVQKS